MKILPVVLSGGAGSRLWPLSREKYPKQLLPLIGEESMLQATLHRLDGLPGVLDPLLVCNEEHRFVVAEQIRLTGRRGTLILEPVGRNTAPALTLAALWARRSGEDPVLVVMPADHDIRHPEHFRSAARDAADLAEAGMLVTFGITPDAPETGYGYIRCGRLISGDGGACELAGFDEKPDSDTARRYLESGEYLWNSGIFVLRASTWLSALAAGRPDILESCRAAINADSASSDFIMLERHKFEACPSDSIDYAVMEKLDGHSPGFPRGAVIPFSSGWSDVGAWDTLWKVLPKSEKGNAGRGDVIFQDSRDTLAIAESRLVACIGVSNLIIVETHDAVLVAHHEASQDVKHMVEQMKARGMGVVQWHRKVHRPWGWYDGVDCGHRFQVKHIMVRPGAALSLQMHHHRAEHWVVVSGTARVTKGSEVFLVSENESTYIPIGTAHRLENPGRVPLEMVEVQSGSYLGEDDIVRFDDSYGRQ